MAQNDFGVINPNTKSGTELASDLNGFRDAVNSNHMGSARPAYAVAGLTWVNNTSSPWIYYLYDGADDIKIGEFDTTTNVFTPESAVTGPASSTDNALSRFDGVTGKLLQDSGVTVDDSGNMAGVGTINGNDADTLLVDADIETIRLVPQNSKSAAYTLVASDAGKHIFHPSADTTARTFTIPANASVAFAIGTAVTFVNQNGAGVVTIAITSDTLRLAGDGTTGSRTLAANGVATALKVTATEWIISGTGLT